MTDKAKTATPCAAVILAAGKGTRMKSSLPKVLHPIAGRPMLLHVLSSVAELAPERLAVVLAKEGMDSVRKAVVTAHENAEIVYQDPARDGTAAAVSAASSLLDGFKGVVFVLFGDTPLITVETLHRMREAFEVQPRPAVVVLGMRPADPAEYGRLVLNDRGELQEIVEFKEADEAQRQIGLCNSGVMAIDGEKLAEFLPKIGNNNAKLEYYLTDLVGISRVFGANCRVIEAPESEVLGVNSRDQLAAAEAVMQSRLRHRAMVSGVTLHLPETVYFQHDTQLANDVTVHPHVVFGPNVQVESGVEIRAFSHLEGAKIARNAIIGPFARLRPGAEIGEAAHVGNFVEIKKSTLEKGVKANHLTYIGDAHIGAGSNIGAGTITCNYDGFDKHHTRIGEGVFIGSNTALVAPVHIGDNAVVGAGSVITDDVEAEALAVTRAPQIQKRGWAANFRMLKRSKRVN